MTLSQDTCAEQYFLPEGEDSRYEAVVFDLFGTLVAAPTGHERFRVAMDIAAVLDVPAASVEQVLITSWHERHDGTLRTVDMLAGYLAGRCDVRSASASTRIKEVLSTHAQQRLRVDPSVHRLLHGFRHAGVRIGVLSDASADVAALWPHCDIADLVTSAVFSCRSGALKPTPRLYGEVISGLDVSAHRTLYCGDGGGDELRGAVAAGLRAVRVGRRGGGSGLAFNDQPWPGPSIDSVELLPDFIAAVEGAC